LLALAACVIVVAVLGLLVKGQTTADGFDNAVDGAVIAFFAGHRGVLGWLAWPATSVPAIALSAAAALGCLVTRRLNGALLAVTAVSAAAALDDALLKHLFHRTYLGQLAFPSGHTTSVSAQAALLAVLLLVPPQRPGTRAARVALVAVFYAILLVTATGVIALRWHYFTDTVAGAAVGTGTVLVLAFLIDLAFAATRRTETSAIRCTPGTRGIGRYGRRCRTLPRPVAPPGCSIDSAESTAPRPLGS
jgi:membrane-associated phospholipid phosphatase